MAVKTLAQIRQDLRRERSVLHSNRKDLSPGISQFTLLRDLIDSLGSIIVSEKAYGGISVIGNVTTTTLNSGAHVQIVNFTTNDPSNRATPDHANDHITVDRAGTYMIVASISVANGAAQGHTIHIEGAKNGGTIDLTPVHAHRTLTGGSTDIGSISVSGIVELNLNDTVELWANTNVAADRVVTFEDIALSIIEI